MERSCDNTSVGVIVRNEAGHILLLDRAKFPYGKAAPAGHIDEHGTPEQAAVEEVFEEVGLRISIDTLKKVIDARRVDNRCRRAGGDHHDWTVYAADGVSGDVVASPDETRGHTWYSADELQALADRTRTSTGLEDVPGAPVLERIWLDFLVELDYIR